MVYDNVLSPDGGVVAWRTGDNRLEVYSVVDQKKLWEVPIGRSERLLFLSGGEHLVRWSSEWPVRVMDARTGKLIVTLWEDGVGKWVLLLPDGHYWGTLGKKDFPIGSRGSEKPIGEHPGYTRSQSQVGKALAEAFKGDATR